MKIRLEPIPICDQEALKAACTPRRKSMAQSILNIHERSEDPLVVAIDGQWGSGKTIFLKYLEILANEGNINVLYYDAFENDISLDAFASFASFLYSHISNKDKTESSNFAKAAAKVGMKSINKVAGNAIGIVTSGLIGKDEIDSAIKVFKNANQSYSELVEYIESHSDRQSAKSALKEALSNTLGAKSNIDSKGTLIIVDEIDRCRPDFAIETIECVKHLFHSEGITFVIGADFNQLNKIVSSAQKNSASVSNYMEKFYDLRFSLGMDNRNREANHQTIFKAVLKHTSDTDNRHLQTYVLDDATKIFAAQGASFRTYISFLQSYNISCLMCAYRMDNYEYIALITALKFLDPESYIKVMNGTASFEDLSSTFSKSNCTQTIALIQHIEEQKGMYRYLQELALDVVELGQD